jgi:menaquinone-9 beta-reductase
MRRDADAIIVGGGPAGSATGLLLARAGFDVLILDRHDFPRPKPCGDCLSAAATPLLERLGVLPDVLRLPHAGLDSWQIFAPDGSSFRGGFPDDTRALAVERSLLDNVLLDAAAAAGARVLTGRRVTGLLHDGGVAGVTTSDGALTARLTIGADGLRSIVATRLGAVARAPRRRKLSLTLHLPAAPAGLRAGEMHSGDGLCAGIAPLTAAGDRANLTVVADTDRYGRAVADDPRAFVHYAIDTLPALRGRVDAAGIDTVEILASGPFDRPMSRVIFDGAALVGDAAGYFDPFTGQGVHHALLGAELLAATAARALHAADCSARRLADYERALRRTLRGPRFVQRGIDCVLARPRLASTAIRRIRAAPAFAAAIIAVTGDTAPATHLLEPRVLFSLLRSA